MIDSLLRYKYILIRILEKLPCLLRDCNQFYDEGCVKFSVPEKKGTIFVFSSILKCCVTNMLKLM